MAWCKAEKQLAETHMEAEKHTRFVEEKNLPKSSTLVHAIRFHMGLFPGVKQFFAS